MNRNQSSGGLFLVLLSLSLRQSTQNGYTSLIGTLQ